MKKTFFSLALTIGIFFSVPSFAAEISTGYTADNPLTVGTVVSSVIEDKTAIEQATLQNISTLLGVVVADNESLVEISDQSDNVRVATHGVVRVLVTAFDGPIQEGSYIAPGSLSGIGSLAERQSLVLGVAKESFDGTGGNVLGSVADLVSGFNSETIPADTQIGLIEVELNVVANPNLQQGGIDAIGQYFTDRGTGPLRFFLAFIIFVATVDIVGAVLYGSTRGSMISIGRNPLARKPVYVGLAEVSFLSVAILALSLIAMFLILK